MNTVDIGIPQEMMDKWQGVVDLIAEIVKISAALIMRVDLLEIEVFLASRNKTNPYEPGERAQLNTGLYCETVMKARDRLFVPDARKDRKWEHNPDMKLGMISYLGYPLVWPDREVFGTICILDRKPLRRKPVYEKVMLQFRDVIESDLRYLFRHEQEQQSMQKVLSQSEMSRRALLSILEDQKQAEEALKESEEKYRTLFESAPEAITLVDNDSRVLQVNREFTRMFGYTPEEVIGDSIDGLITDDDYQEKAISITRRVAKGESINLETVRRRKDGTVLNVSILGKPIRVAGEQVALYGIYRDITEQKRAEKLQTSIYRISEAVQSAENLNELFQTIHNIIGDLMPTNNFYIALYNADSGYLSFPYFVDEYDEPPAPKRMGKGLTEYVLRNGEPLLATQEVIADLAKRGEIDLIGTVPIDWMGVPLKTEDKTIGLLATQSYAAGHRHTDEHKDILMFVSTQVAMAIQRKQAEEELRQTNEELTTANVKLWETMRKLEEARDELELALDAAKESDRLKSEFLANTSHELRTPLNSIIGFLKLILDDLCDSPEEERQFIGNALESSQQLLGLINDVLDIAKIEAGKMELTLETVHLQDIFDEVYVLTHVQAEQKNIDLNFSLEQEQEIVVKADYQKVKQVLLNILGNSIKFTSRGVIDISARTMPKEKLAEIQVRDTGIGIHPDKQKTIFDKFTQADGSTSRKYGGTGLGLTITKSLVELMRGSIKLTSPGVDQGTTVTFTLPLSPKSIKKMPEIAELVPSDERTPLLHEKPQIVIVEDDETVRTYLEKLLLAEGYVPFTTETADQGLQLMQQLLPQCAIIDFTLPADEKSTLRDGLSLVAALQENETTRGVPTILITGYEEQVHKILSIKSSVSEKPIVLGKPVDGNKLLSFLDELSQKNNKHALNILLADDDANVSKYLQKLLSKNGYHLTAVSNGKEALDFIADRKGGIDVLLLDLMMPVFNGYEVIRELKVNQKAPDLPIIIITNYPETDTEEQSRLLSKGMIVDLMTKETVNKNPETLLELLRKVTQSERGEA